jgi:phospholipid/cholesterol/gamma-HCH transport system permease protein
MLIRLLARPFAPVGAYLLLMSKVFSRPEKFAIYRRRVWDEMWALGFTSIVIVFIISIFIGAVICIQMALNLNTPLIPQNLIGFATREIVLLEFSSTIIALILAGKVGSSIASEIGTMRITEQIDALEIMGVNSAGYLILPKIIGAVFFFPLLTIFSMFVGILGGYLTAAFTDIMELKDFMNGILLELNEFYFVYALIKTMVYAFLITSIAGYYGYYAQGNSLEVGRASTRAVVASCVAILASDLVLTQLLLT